MVSRLLYIVVIRRTGRRRYPRAISGGRYPGATGGRMATGNALHRGSGKTLVEALVACAVLILLLILIVPALIGNRDQARTYLCEDNLKQLADAAHQYAADHKGKFFPQYQIYVDVVEGVRPDLSLWCDNKRLGQYVTDVEWTDWKFAKQKGFDLDEAVNGIVRCPQAQEEEARSYAQNHWANGLGLVKHKGWNFDLGIYPLGEHFDSGAGQLDQLMLFVESNAMLKSSSGWVTQFAGRYGRPSDRFTGGIHVALDSPMPLRPSMPTQPPSRYRYEIPWALDYSRHGTVNDPFIAEGEINISFADGHVARFQHEKLYDSVTRTSTYDALWSSNDRNYDEIGEPYGLPNR